VLAAVVAYYLITRDINIYRYVEPFWMFGLPSWSEAGVMWIVLGLLLVGTVFVRNLYCRFLCPVGAFLGVISRSRRHFPSSDGGMHSCKLCEKCASGARFRGPEIVKSECVRCERLRTALRGHEEDVRTGSSSSRRNLRRPPVPAFTKFPEPSA